MLARDKFAAKMPKTMSKEEKTTKLEANDRTFINDDPDFGKDIDEFESTVPDRKYTVRGWMPGPDNDRLSELLRTVKMNKSDYFFKVFRESLAMPIYAILRFIEISDYFPKSMRISKLTFLVYLLKFYISGLRISHWASTPVSPA